MKEAEIMTKKYEGNEEPPADYTPEMICKPVGDNAYFCGSDRTRVWGENWFESQSRYAVKGNAVVFRFKNPDGKVRDIQPCPVCYASGLSGFLPTIEEVKSANAVIEIVEEQVRVKRGLFLADFGDE
tara:strand:- start:978 stop:1358 length:381 start_codon:yes stop_codon:yes gene_type:complete